MTRTLWMTALLAALASPAAAQAPAPAPGTEAASVLTAPEVEALLLEAGRTSPAMMVARMHNSDAYRVNVVRRTTAQGAIAHAVGTEVHYVIGGTGTLVTGGTIEGRAGAATIRGGATRTVQPGDVVIVPVGMPHWYSRVDEPLTYLEVRFDVKEP